MSEARVVAPGIKWGPFTLRIPFIHTRAEWPEIVQGCVVAGATGLAIVPIFVNDFGMTFEIAVALCIVQAAILVSSPMLFGEPFCPGWLTPALPLILAAALAHESVADRVEFVTLVVLCVSAIFLFLGLSGLGRLLIRWIPLTLRSGIILGAGLSAILREFSVSAGRTPRLEKYPISISVAVGITLLLLFSLPVDRLKKRYPWLVVLAGLGLAPGFIIAMVLGPLVGEVSYDEFFSLFVDSSTGAWIFGWDQLVFHPDFSGLVARYSPFSSGFVGGRVWSRAPEFLSSVLPLAFAAYVIGFGDIVTGTAIVKSACEGREDEKIPFDDRRTHISIGIRNALQASICGPFFPLQGPLWTGAMVVVAERYRRGREAMRSLFGGIFSYYVFGLPIFFFCWPFIALYRPVLEIALSLTLLLTGFACSYVALALPRDRIERGLTVVTGAAVAFHSTTLGLAVGFALAVALLGKRAWREEKDG